MLQPLEKRLGHFGFQEVLDEPPGEYTMNCTLVHGQVERRRSVVIHGRHQAMAPLV